MTRPHIGAFQPPDKALILVDTTIIFFAKFAWRECLVSNRRERFCSWPPAWRKWRQHKTSNNSFLKYNRGLFQVFSTFRQICPLLVLAKNCHFFVSWSDVYNFVSYIRYDHCMTKSRGDFPPAHGRVKYKQNWNRKSWAFVLLEKLRSQAES